MSEQLQQQIFPLPNSDPGDPTSHTSLQVPVETAAETC